MTAIGGGICMYAVGAYIAIAKPQDHPSASITGGGIAGMVFIYLWTVFYTPSWNGVPWVFCAEIVSAMKNHSKNYLTY